MIVLDTNVISEPIKREPNAQVMEWLDGHDVETLYLTAVNVAELLYGIEVLTEGKRKKSLSSSITKLIDHHIGERILPFDLTAAREYVTIAVQARKLGFGVSSSDAQIASIAAVHGYAVATRDEEAFLRMGVRVINPWKAT